MTEEAVTEEVQLTPSLARVELEQLQGWLQDFSQRQQQLEQVRSRAIFLAGFLAGSDQPGKPVHNGRVTAKK